MGTLQSDSLIHEFVIKRPIPEVVSALLIHHPKIILISVYIWNVEATLQLLRALRETAPDIKLVVGGPEVSYPPLYPGIAEAVDNVVTSEVVPDGIPDELKACFQRFPAGCLQFEVGVQSFNQDVLDRIQHAQRAEKVERYLAWLCGESKAVIHADLIFGLPGETLESMQDSFNRLVVHEPDQIQLNLLKLLKGTPIVRHTEPFGMVYADAAPFEIQETSTIDRDTMQMLREFSRVWTLFHNSEKLKASLPYPFQEQVRLLDDWLQQHSLHPARARQAVIADYSD